jgi:outer membrane protein
MNRKLIAALLTLSFGATSGWAQATDLLQAYREALANDAQFAVARSTVVAGREKYDQGRSALLPQLNASASLFENESETDLSPSRSFTTTDYQLTLTQPLYRWQNWVGYQQGDLLTAQAEVTFAQAEQDLILRVAEAYFNVLNAQESLRATQSQKTAIGQQLELAKKSFEVGTATITDTHEAQARYDLVTAQEAAADNLLEVSRQSLNAILGKEAGALAALKPDAVLSGPQPADLKTWLEQAENNNVQVRFQALNAEIASKSSESARAGHYPTLDFVASYRQAKNDPTSSLGTETVVSETTTLRYGVQLNVPLYAGGGTESRSREAAAQRDAALAGLDGSRRAATLAARQAYLGVVNGLAQVRALQAAEVSSQSALDATKVGYEVGVRINNDVLNAEQQLYATKRDLYKARLDTLLAHLRLKQAVGVLAEDDVRQVNTLLALPAGPA